MSQAPHSGQMSRVRLVITASYRRSGSIRVGAHPRIEPADSAPGRLWDDPRVTPPASPSNAEHGPRAARRFGFAGGLFGRNPDIASLSVVLLVAMGVLIVGLQLVHDSPDWGF